MIAFDGTAGTSSYAGAAAFAYRLIYSGHFLGLIERNGFIGHISMQTLQPEHLFSSIKAVVASTSTLPALISASARAAAPEA